MTIDRIKSDVLVIGAGLAGSFAAIKAKEAGANKVLIVSKGEIGSDGASTFGAGHIYAPPPEEQDAGFKAQALGEYFGAGLFDKDWLRVSIDEAYERLLEMDKWGVPIPKTADGQFKRIVARGNQRRFPLPGPNTMEAMAKRVMGSQIEVLGHIMITDLLNEGGEQGKPIVGAVGFDVRSGDYKVFEAKAVIMASGGCGFKSIWSGHKNLTGDGIVAAYRAGAKLGGFEISNLIVTGADYDIMGQNPLVALGAFWVNALGERFMEHYDPHARDKAVTSRLSAALAMELRGGRGPIYLDITRFSPEDIENFRVMYPLTIECLKRAGVMEGGKITKKIEVMPAFAGTFNNTGGGIAANTKCETSLKGLFACGDAMIRRMHEPKAISGAAVSGARAGKFAALYASGIQDGKINYDQVELHRTRAFAPLEREDGIEPDHLMLRILEEITPYEVSIIARSDRLESAIREIEKIREDEISLLIAWDPHYLRLANEVENMVYVAEMYLRSRLMREESRDSCLREDYPYIDNESWLKWTCFAQIAGKMTLWTEDIPIDDYETKPERGKILHPVFEAATKRGVRWG